MENNQYFHILAKVQENANQLEKLASMQNVILAQAGPMNLSHQPSSYASAPPAWAKQILDQSKSSTF